MGVMQVTCRRFESCRPDWNIRLTRHYVPKRPQAEILSPLRRFTAVARGVAMEDGCHGGFRWSGLPQISPRFWLVGQATPLVGGEGTGQLLRGMLGAVWAVRARDAREGLARGAGQILPLHETDLNADSHGLSCGAEASLTVGPSDPAGPLTVVTSLSCPESDIDLGDSDRSRAPSR